MAVTVSKTPGTVAFAKNEIIFEMTTDRYIDNTGTNAVGRIQVDVLPSVGDTFIVAWDEGNVAIEFTVATLANADADTTGTLIPEPTGTIGAFVSTALSYVQSNQLINALFIVGVSANRLTFTARKKGVKYTMFTDLNDGSAWITNTVTTTGVDPALDQDFYLIAKTLIKEPNGSWTELAELAHKPDQNQKVSFNLAPVLRSYVDKVHLPPVGHALPIDLDEIIRTYRVIFFEKKPSVDGSLQPVYQTDQLRVMFAGLNRVDFKNNPDPFETVFMNQQKFLSWLPSTREVRTDQDQFLSFINYDETITGDPVGGGGGAPSS